jgi:hypothetical protein
MPRLPARAAGRVPLLALKSAKYRRIRGASRSARSAGARLAETAPMRLQNLRGRAPAALLSLYLCVTAACIGEPALGPGAGAPDAGAPDAAPPDGIEIPRGVSLPPLAYTLALTYPTGPSGPDTITGHLYLDVDAGGQVAGGISAVGTGPVALAKINGRVEGAEIVFLDSGVGVAPDGSLSLDELRISLLDQDGDGAADSAAGRATGLWLRGQGEIAELAMHTSTLTAGLDTTATTASLVVPHDDLELLPYDAVHVFFEEPLREADVRDELRILAGGTAITGELIFYSAGGLVTGATFQPDRFLPYGAEVTIDLAGLQDPSGNALAASAARAPVIPDPGVLSGSAGFETDLAGWIVLGQVSTQGAFQGLAPAEGAAQAVVPEGSTLAAALDVAADATELELSVALLTRSATSADAAAGKAVVALRAADGEQIAIFDAGDVAGQLQPCATCTEYGQVVGPLRRTIDLTPLRGRRVFLIVDVQESSWWDPNGFAALVDDIQIR